VAVSDGFTAELDATDVLDALRRFPDAVLKETKPASKISADSIQREAQRRVRRLSGETAERIRVVELRNGTGYLVESTNMRMPNLPIWLEAGTKRMSAKPYFYESVRLESNAHERRIGEAVGRAISGLGL
jgi:hypothetical protein